MVSDLTMHLTSIESTVAGWRRGEIPADVAMKAVGAYVTDVGLLADPTTSRTDAEQAVIDAAIAETNVERARPSRSGSWALLIEEVRKARRAAVDRLAATEEAT